MNTSVYRTGASVWPASWRLGNRWTEQAGAVALAPVLLALALGWFRAGSVGRDLSLFYSMLFWLCMWLGYWAVAGFSTMALERAVPALRRRPWLLLIAGGTIASAASAFYLDPYMSFFDPLLSADDRVRIAQFGALPASVRVPAAIESSCFGILAWTAVNLFALRLGRAATADLAPPTVSAPAVVVAPPVTGPLGVTAAPPVEVAPAPKAVPPRLDALLQDASLDEVIAVQAQDHYVLVHLAQSRRLLHYRFRDAVADLARHEGAQVHRSWWLSAAAVRTAKRIPGSSALRIDGDLTVPIGRSHREELERLRGRSRGRERAQVSSGGYARPGSPV